MATETPDAVDHHISSVNTITGEAIEIGGFDASHNNLSWKQDSRFLVMYEPHIEQPELTTYQVIDAVTGDVIDELVDIPLPDGHDPGLSRRSVASTSDGSVEIIDFGSSHIYLMRMENGERSQALFPARAPVPSSSCRAPARRTAFLSLRFSWEGSSRPI